jgi:internalin A
VTDAGLGHLKGLATFWRKLSLRRTQVTDAGLVRLKGLARIIHSLDLSGTQVTNAGLGHLKDLVYLKEVSLIETKVTDKGIADLQKALPRARIAH